MNKKTFEEKIRINNLFRIFYKDKLLTYNASINVADSYKPNTFGCTFYLNMWEAYINLENHLGSTYKPFTFELFDNEDIAYHHLFSRISSLNPDNGKNEMHIIRMFLEGKILCASKKTIIDFYVDGFKRNPDIAKEFQNFIITGNIDKQNESPVNIYGFTASGFLKRSIQFPKNINGERLYCHFAKNQYEIYLLLVLLRENNSLALKFLKNRAN